MAGRCHRKRDQRPQRGGAGDRRCGRHARRAHGAAEGFRRARLRLLHEFRERQGPRDSWQHEGGDVLSLEVAAPPGAHPRAMSRSSAMPRPTPISLHGRAAAASAPGRRSSRARWKAASRWKRPSRNIRRATRSAKFRVRSTGRVSASCRPPSSSGTTGHFACMTGSPSAAGRMAAGTRTGFTPEGFRPSCAT